MKKKKRVKPKKQHVPTKFYDEGGLPITSGNARKRLRDGGRVKTTPRKGH